MISFFSGALFSACSPIYVIRAAYEEGKILWRREPIRQLLQKPDLNSETEEKFKLVLAVREYARDSLKLKVGGSYTSYSYVDRPVLSYVLMATPKTDLKPYTWWYFLVGRLPYKGFFSQEAAEAEASQLREKKYDTYIRTSPAYSTLGWFDDPLLAHLLKVDKATLATVILHELLHSTLFIGGAVDFNESLADFVGNQGAILFFQDRYGKKSPEFQKAVQSWQEELEFSVFITGVAGSLKALYEKEVARKEKLRLREKIFSRSQEDWSRRIANRPAHPYRSFSQQKINNAVIAHYLLYLKGLQLFESLYQAEGKDLGRLVSLIAESVQDREDPFQTVQKLLRKRPL